MFGDNIFDPGQAVCGRITAHALIVHSIAKSVLIKEILQIIRITSSCYSGRQTVAEGDDNRTIVLRVRSR